MSREQYAHALWRTWNVIAWDIIQASENGTVLRDEVFEVTVDFLSMYGEMTASEVQAFARLPADEREAIKLLAFTYSEYCL